MGRTFEWDRLSAVDASNFVFEHAGQAYGIGLVGVLDAAPLVDANGDPDVERLRRLLGPRVAAIPRLRQKVRFTRWGEGLPVWVDCPVDLAVHVRGGPPIDGEDALAQLCGQLISEPLPRDRPLWDLLVARGPEPDEVTVVLRLHHALADGLSGVRLLQALFDPAGPDSPAPPPPTPLGARPAPRPQPTSAELVADVWRTRGARLAHVLAAASRARPTRARIRAVGGGIVRLSVIVRGGLPPTSLLGPVGDRRGLAFASADLTEVRAVAHTTGATVNDVLLDAVAQATATLLRARGEPPLATLPVSVPVSLRSDTAGATGNRVGVMLVRLPLETADPTERLARIAAATRDGKIEARRAGSLEITRSRLGARLFDVFSRRQRTVALFVTNVPGPVERPTLAGAALRRAWPLSVIAGNIRFAVAALSFAGGLHVTTTFDVRSCPDAHVFTNALAAALHRSQTTAAPPTDAAHRADAADEIGARPGPS